MHEHLATSQSHTNILSKVVPKILTTIPQLVMIIVITLDQLDGLLDTRQIMELWLSQINQFMDTFGIMIVRTGPYSLMLLQMFQEAGGLSQETRGVEGRQRTVCYQTVHISCNTVVVLLICLDNK